MRKGKINYKNYENQNENKFYLGDVCFKRKKKLTSTLNLDTNS